MSKQTRNQRTGFSERLVTAMKAAGVEPRPYVLEREFNLKYHGRSITYQGARRWLRGLSIPEEDKLVCIARWLGADPHHLRYGSPPGNGTHWPGVQDSPEPWARDLSAEERAMVMMMRRLPTRLRRILHGSAAAFLDSTPTSEPIVDTEASAPAAKRPSRKG